MGIEDPIYRASRENYRSHEFVTDRITACSRASGHHRGRHSIAIRRDETTNVQVRGPKRRAYAASAARSRVLGSRPQRFHEPRGQPRRFLELQPHP